VSRPADSPILELRGVSKTFGAVRALRSVDLSLFAGEVLGLVGDNGAGKSTLINILAGTLSPDEGEIVIYGATHVNDSPADARRAGIETVFQSLRLVPALDIAENVYLNRELLHFGEAGRWLPWMNKRRMRAEAESGLHKLGLRLPPATTKVSALSGGQRQAVAVARAVFWGSRIVLMDEPTAALGVRQTEIVLNFIERLKSHGVGVILISHNVQHVLRVCDRVAVLRLGRKVLETPRSETSGNQLVAAITGVTDLAQ
jgi:ABC-type sugar transport system ATPase subunit